jgi:hypothetical protein
MAVGAPAASGATGTLADHNAAKTAPTVTEARRQLLSAITHHPQLRASAIDRLATPYISLFRVVLQRADAARQLRAGADIELLARAFSALTFERIAGYGLAVDEAFVVRVVDGLLLPGCIDSQQPTAAGGRRG